MSSVNNLFNFDDIGGYYCVPTDIRPFTMTISYSSPVLLTEIGIHGYDGPLLDNRFVTEFSLSFSVDGENFTDYIQGTKSTSTVCCYHGYIIFIYFVYRCSLYHVMRCITLYCVLPSLPLV